MVEIPLHNEIEQRFGVLPNFFRLAGDNPEVTTNLWGFAKFAYLDSPLPSLFKERLFVYLSRFCEVRYCIARHIGFLVGLGYPAGDRDCLPQTVEQILPLLQRSLPRGEALEPAIALCAAFDPSSFEYPSPDTAAEAAIFVCATHVFLQTPDAPGAIAALRQGLGTARLELLNVFLAFVRMAHYWTQIHPELRCESDINHLLATHEALANCLLNDPEVADNTLNQRVLAELVGLRQLKAEHESLTHVYDVVSRENEQLSLEIQKRQRVEENLRKSEEKYRTLFESIDEGFCVCELIVDEADEAYDYRILEINSAFEALTGLKQATGKTGSELIPTLEPFWYETYARVVRTGEPYRFESYLQAWDSWFDVYVTPIGAPQGQQFAVLFSNVTERKRHEANLVFLAEIQDDCTRLTAADTIMQTIGAKIGAYLNLSACAFVDIDEAQDQAIVPYAWHRADVPNLAGTYRISDFANEEFHLAARAGKVAVVNDTNIDACRAHPTVGGLQAGLARIAEESTKKVRLAGCT